MQVKKFEAPTMQDALKIIKKELGPDAIILSTKQNRKGFGLMSKDSVEVTAAIAEKSIVKKKITERNLPQNVKEKIWSYSAEKQAEVYDDYFEKQLKKGSVKVDLKNKKEQKTPVAATTTVTTAKPTLQKPITEKRYADITEEDGGPAPQSWSTDNNAKVASLERDIEYLRDTITKLATKKNTEESESAEHTKLSEGVSHAYQTLVNAGIEKKLARHMIEDVKNNLNEFEQMDEAVVQERIAFHLMGDLKIKDPLKDIGARAGKAKTTFLALVGPTGVGKTTTIAKIASQGIVNNKLRVGLINLDTYKVAAVDQLSTYARLMNVPFRSVANAEELRQAVYDFGSLDLVLIDTTGRSQKDQDNLVELRKLLSSVADIETILIISATTRDSDLNDIIKRFKIFNPSGLIFSKLDETSVYGCIYNTQKRTHLPLNYFTVGQRVPEDIEKASAERVIDLVLEL